MTNEKLQSISTPSPTAGPAIGVAPSNASTSCSALKHMISTVLCSCVWIGLGQTFLRCIAKKACGELFEGVDRGWCRDYHAYDADDCFDWKVHGWVTWNRGLRIQNETWKWDLKTDDREIEASCWFDSNALMGHCRFLCLGIDAALATGRGVSGDDEHHRSHGMYSWTLVKTNDA